MALKKVAGSGGSDYYELCSHFDNGLNGRKTPNRINSLEVTTN